MSCLTMTLVQQKTVKHKELFYQRSSRIPTEIKEGIMISELLEIKRQMHETCAKRKAVLFLHKGCAGYFQSAVTLF